MYPTLSLSQIPLDDVLARRLPRRLAHYHLALPIAEDDDGITVAMAYPENARAVTLIEGALGARVLPVRSFPGDLQTAIDRVWQVAADQGAGGLLTWADSEQGRVLAATAAELMAPALAEPVIVCPAETLNDLIDYLQTSGPELLVVHIEAPGVLAELLSRSPVSLLLVRGTPTEPSAMLQLLRGHSPDRKGFDWLLPLARHFHKTVTLLAAAEPSVMDHQHGSPLNSDFADLVLSDNDLHRYGDLLSASGVGGRLKIRQQALTEAVLTETAGLTYNFLAVAVEAYGDFVAALIPRLSPQISFVLIIKP